MTPKEELAAMEDAEDLFELFGVSYDPRVLTVHRLQFLKYFGGEVADIDKRTPPVDDAARRRLYAEALKKAHDYYASGAAKGTSVFPGLKGRLVELGANRSRPALRDT